MPQWETAREAVLEAALKMTARGLVAGTSGNVSVRLRSSFGKELLAITPTSRPYDTLKPDDIPIIDFEGRPADGVLAPSIETPLHIGVYKARANVGAVIHTHSVYASALAVLGQDVPPILEDQVAYLGGEIRLAPYAASGTPEQVAGAVAALGERSGLLLANHGAVGTGRDLRAAFTACEIMEKTAQVWFLAAGAGKVNTLPAAAVARFKAMYALAQSGPA